MLTDEDKKKLDVVFESAKKGEPTACIACMFMTEEQKEYMQSLCNYCKNEVDSSLMYE